MPRRQERLDTAVLDVANLTGESVSLGVVQQNQIILVAVTSRLPSPLRHLRYVISVGDSVAMDETAMGRVVLANSTSQQQRRLLGRLPRSGETFLEEHSSELEQVRTDRFAVCEDSGGVVGLMCVAVPVLDRAGRIGGALSVAGPPSDSRGVTLNPSFQRCDEPPIS